MTYSSLDAFRSATGLEPASQLIDGIDQVVLSSVQWLNASPCALKNDTTILPQR